MAAAVDRNNKPLPSPRLGPSGVETYRSARKTAPASRASKVNLDVADDDVDAANSREIDEADAAEPFTLVPHVAEQTLHAVHNAIFGQPWADLELVVSAGGKKEEVVYANSKVLKKACPALMRQMSMTGRVELDTMEHEQLNAATDKNKPTAAGAKKALRPQASRRSTNSLGLADFGGRGSRLGGLDEQDDASPEVQDRPARKHAEDAEEDEYADSLAEQPKHHNDHSDHDDGTHQDVDDLDEDDLDADSPLGSRGKVAGATPPAPAPLEVAAPPTFSRSSSRFSKLIKFINKERGSPTSDDAPVPFSSIGNATGTDYAQENGTVGRGRVRRYSAGNDLSSVMGTRTPTASRVQVTGCSAATLQALVFYLYTGHATFASRLPAPAPSRRYGRARRDSSSTASFNSDRSGSADEHSAEELGNEDASIPALCVSKSPSYPPVFSATAAYCVGRQLGLRDLATKAFDHICLELSPKTVLADLLSPFVDRFDEVQRAHLEYVSDNWDRVKRRPDFEHTVNRLVSGGYPKANKALLKLFAKLSVAERN